MLTVDTHMFAWNSPIDHAAVTILTKNKCTPWKIMRTNHVGPVVCVCASACGDVTGWARRGASAIQNQTNHVVGMLVVCGVCCSEFDYATAACVPPRACCASAPGSWAPACWTWCDEPSWQHRLPVAGLFLPQTSFRKWLSEVCNWSRTPFHALPPVWAAWVSSCW